MERTRIAGKTWTIIVILALVGQVAWAVENNFFNLFIQDAFGASLSDVALMVSASALTATATTRLVGVWSDRAGRRKVFVVAGTLLWGLSILVFAMLQDISASLARDAAAAAALGITLTIAFDCVMTFFGSLANDSCFNAWVTDITDDTNRGRVEGVNSAMPLLSMLVVFGSAMFFMIVGDDGSVTYDYPAFFAVIGGIVIAAGIAAAIRNNTPLDRVGLYQGVRIFCIVLVPMLIGPWIGSTISASSGAMVGFGVVGDGFTPSSLIFAGGAVVALLAFIVLFAIRRAEKNEA